MKSITQKTGKKFHWGKVIIYAILILYTLFLMVPFAIMIITSVTPDVEYITTDGYIWFPKSPSMESYRTVFLDDPFATNGIPSLLVGFFNTMWMTLIPLVSSLLLSGIAAYCYSKHKFLGKEKLFFISVMTMFIPLGAFGIVSYMMFMSLGWTEGWRAVLPIVVPGLFGSVGTVFFLRPYFDSISNEIIEAARIDGMGFWQIFFKIMLPLGKPAFISQFIFGFVGGYNNYGAALLYLFSGDPKFWTLQLALQQLVEYAQGGYIVGVNVSCAATLMSMLPLIVLYIFCQKYFIKGIAVGGGKE